jgi:hypothetical protein
MIGLTPEEQGALLRAARERLDRLTEEVTRMHFNAAEGQGDYYRKMADIDSAEAAHLQSAVRKLWLLATK